MVIRMVQSLLLWVIVVFFYGGYFCNRVKKLSLLNGFWQQTLRSLNHHFFPVHDVYASGQALQTLIDLTSHQVIYAIALSLGF